jgi:cysteate synthase
VEAIGELPAHYFQAVGSGTGGIAAWEMSRRIINDGGYGDAPMKLHLVQNQPFAIIADAWQASARELAPIPEKAARRRIRRIRASVLANRKPPYGIAGGVFDALTDTGGYMYAVSNRDAREAGWLFEKLEGCDLDPAAEVCVAGLIQALNAGQVGRDELVLLNITGGGARKLAAEDRRYLVQPDLTFTPEHNTREKVAARLVETMGGRRQGVLQC